MKNLIATLMIIISFSSLSYAQGNDKSHYPYFKIISETTSSEQFPLKATDTEVYISGVIADVSIFQTFQNTGSEPIEAIYVFPASTKAAVYDMEMKIGERRIKAKIKEKNEAKTIYAEAKQEGKKASLLEQDRPNVFTMNVANILPGEEVEIVLRYTEYLSPESGVYSFVYPAVVGPRFTGEETKNTSKEIASVPYTESELTHSYDFDLSVRINGGMVIQDIDSKTHEINIQYLNMNEADVILDIIETTPGDRDFVLTYQLAGTDLNSGLLLFEDGEEKFFMLTMQPPKRVEEKHIPAREFIFVVDVSGSMGGFPMDISKKLMRNLLTNLRPIDQFNIMTFASSASLYAEESLYADVATVQTAINTFEHQSGGGGTRLLSALQKAIALPVCEDGTSRSIVIISDGYISVEQEVFDLIKKNGNQANFFSFGIGSSVNRHLMEGIAHVGMGEAMIVTEEKEAPTQAEKFRNYIKSPVLTKITTDFGKFEAYDLEPNLVADVLAERPITITGKYRGDAKGVIEIGGYTGGAYYKQAFNVENYTASYENRSIKYLWARNKIKLLGDYNSLGPSEKRDIEITNLGLKYNLLTAFTSFIAVDEVLEYASRRNKNEELKSVSQPLPLPKGVSNQAIGIAPQVAYANTAFGFEMSIEQEMGWKGMKSLEIEGVNNALNEFEEKMIASTVLYELKKLRDTERAVFKDQKIFIEIGTNGGVNKIYFNDNLITGALANQIMLHIKNWMFLIQKEKPFTVLMQLK